ncbi:MAG: trehalose-phosphatase [Candidatus Omnitrophica bacterium]|nr:trehalose-phosphatase [Candidatus Omnitrophota bacterium]
MKYLFDKWESLQRKIRNKYLFIFLDYDGTLTPIVETPQKAVISKETKDLLRVLARAPRCKIAVISGRSLRDIKKKVGLKKIIFVGNHGLEIEGRKIKHVNMLSLRYRSLLRKIKRDLEKNLACVKGVILEDKGLSFTVHYRLVESGDIPKVKSIFKEATELLSLKNKIKAKTGKMIFEVSPPLEWNKGKAALWLLARHKFSSKEKMILPIYIGDDRTDEDAFKVLNRNGITVFVGNPRSSHAEYYLKDTKEVNRFIKKTIDLLAEKPCQN